MCHVRWSVQCYCPSLIGKNCYPRSAQVPQSLDKWNSATEKDSFLPELQPLIQINQDPGNEIKNDCVCPWNGQIHLLCCKNSTKTADAVDGTVKSEEDYFGGAGLARIVSGRLPFMQNFNVTRPEETTPRTVSKSLPTGNKDVNDTKTLEGPETQSTTMSLNNVLGQVLRSILDMDSDNQEKMQA